MPKEEKIKIGEGYGTIPTGSPAMANINPSLVVKANSIAPSVPITLPTGKTDTTNYNADIAGMQATIDANNKTLTTPPITPLSAADQYVASLESLNAPSTANQYATDYSASGIDANQQDILAKQQVLQTAQSKLASINARLAGISAETKASVLTAEGRLAPQGAIVGEQAAIERSRAIRALPIQAEALGAQAEVQAAQGNVQLAQDTLRLAQDRLNTVFTMHTEDAKNRYNAQKDLISAVYTQASAKEKILLDANLKEEERAYQERKDNVNNAQQWALKAMENGQSSLASQITALDPKSPDYVQKLAALQGQVIVKQKAGTTGRETPTLTPEQAKDPFIAKLAASAGGKPITDTFAQQLNKGLAVLGQLGVLQTNIKDVSTGPIVGAFRGMNPWDTNAQTIKAQLNAIVPNLARGVYGEVGVLTDNDIAQYSKTLPNLKSPDDIRNAVLGITVDLIGKSIKRTLEINAANQKDVSGFVDLYTEMQSTRDAIFSQIPGYKGVGAQTANIAPEKASMFDSVMEQSSQGNYFSNLWNAITGK